MMRRLYFLIPDVNHAERLVRRLVENGIGRNNIHAVARGDIDISRLPKSTHMQQYDTAKKVESWLWSCNLAVFFTALVISLLLIIVFQSPFWALLPVGLMLTCFYTGFRFATRVPNTRMHELNTAIRHGEILLLLDVPKHRVHEIERLVSRTHPEATAGGVGWSLPVLQL